MNHEEDNFATTFKTIITFLFILTVVLIIGANFIASDDTPPTASSPVPDTIKPVGKVKLASESTSESAIQSSGAAMATTPATSTVTASAAPAASAGPADGKATFTGACFACHGTGAAGAPKLGDKAAWAERIAQGMSVLEEHAIKGYQGKKGFMPAKGGRADLSDTAVKAAVAYMVSESQ